MATTPVPAFAAPPDFPALSDRATGTYNSKAYAWATAIQGSTGPNIHAIALTAKANADDAALSTTAAAAQVVLAAGQVTLAEAQALEASDQADRAEDMADAAAANAAYKGDWASLSGALAVPATVTHSGERYVLLSNVANVTAHEPGVSAVWQKLTVAQEKLVSGTNIKTVGGQSLLGSGDITLGSTITPMLVGSGNLSQAHAGKMLVINGANVLLTLPLASQAGNGWFVIVRNTVSYPAGSSLGTATIAPAGADLIDDCHLNKNLLVQPGLTYMIVCDGAAYRSVKIGGRGVIIITSGTSWRCPAGVHQGKIGTIGGGGGGGGGKSAGSCGSGGGQGGVAWGFASLTPSESYAISIGAGGAGGAGGTTPASGADGGTTSFTTYGSGKTQSSLGGKKGLAGIASLTEWVGGGQPGGSSFFDAASGYASPVHPGGSAYGNGLSSSMLLNGDFSPGFVIGGTPFGRGGKGGSNENSGASGSPGAIIIEY